MIPSTASNNSTVAQHLSRVYKLYLTFFDQAIKENIAQNRARAQAAMQATAQAQAAQAQAHAQATAQAVAHAHTTHTLIPHGIPLTQFLTQYVGLQQSYVDNISAQERFLLLEWTQLSEGELRNKVKASESMVGMVARVREKLKEMREGSSGVRERPGFTTSVAVGIVLPGMKVPPPPSAPPIGPVPPVPNSSGVPALPAPSSAGSLHTGVRFISSGLKGEPLPPPEPKMGSKASFEVVYRLIQECNSKFCC